MTAPKKVLLAVSCCLFSLVACGNDIQTRFVGKIAIQKTENNTIRVLVNPCGAPYTLVNFRNVIPEGNVPKPPEKFSKTIQLESPKRELFDLKFSLDPSAPNSLDLFTKDLGEINLWALAEGKDTRSFSTFAYRDELVNLKEGELINQNHQITTLEDFEHCTTTFEKI